MSDHAYRTLCRALAGIAPGYHVTIDLIRDECDAANLTSAEKSGAFRSAAHDGYLTGVFLTLPGLDVMHPVQAAVPSRHPAGKGRHVKVWRRTSKLMPACLCAMTEAS